MSVLKLLQNEAKDISVLYVEDEETIRLQTEQFLRKFFSSLDVAVNGQEGLKSYREKKQNLVISDINMPLMNGLQMAEEIKKLNHHVEVIIISAYSEKELLLQSIDIGVIQYVIKPIDSNLFASTLLKTIRSIKLERKAERLQKRVQNILNFQENLLLVTDLEKATAYNRSFLRFFGFANARELKESGFELGSRLIAENGFFSVPKNVNVYRAIINLENRSQKVKILNRKNNKYYIFALTSSPLPESDEYIISFTDITVFEAQYEDLELRAKYDLLTRVYNRLHFESTLDEEISRARTHSQSLALLMVDLDDFGKVNEKVGYENGDSILIQVADILKRNLRSFDTLARWESEKFIVLAPHTNVGRAFSLGEKLRQAVETASFNEIDTLTCSVGVVQFKMEESHEDLIKRTETMLQHAKKFGKNNTKASVDSMSEEVSNHKEQVSVAKTLDFIAHKDEALKLTCIYKGLTIAHDCKVLSVDSDQNMSATVNLHPTQTPILQKEKMVYLEHRQFARVLKADVLNLDTKSHQVVLRNFSYVDSSPVQRRALRMIPREYVEVTVLYGTHDMMAQLLDVSSSALSLKLLDRGDMLLGEDIKCIFSLPVGKAKKPLQCEARILKIEEMDEGVKVVASLLGNKHASDVIMQFIAARQMEILNEVHNTLV